MKNIVSGDKEYIDRIFSGSAYQNSHLGWLDLWQLFEIGGGCRLFESDSQKYLIAVQPVTDRIYWLHSFYCSTLAGSPNIVEQLKNLLPPGIHSVYTLSSHNWFSRILEANGFRQCDEIIQMETDRVSHPKHKSQHVCMKLHPEILPDILSDCETSFPPLWRMNSLELQISIKGANYARYIADRNTILGYILADITDNCHILRLAVRQEYQQEGIASALTDQLISDCENIGISRFSVNTNKKNSAAVCLYQSLNLSQEGKTFPLYNRCL